MRYVILQKMKQDYSSNLSLLGQPMISLDMKIYLDITFSLSNVLLSMVIKNILTVCLLHYKQIQKLVTSSNSPFYNASPQQWPHKLEEQICALIPQIWSWYFICVVLDIGNKAEINLRNVQWFLNKHKLLS